MGYPNLFRGLLLISLIASGSSGANPPAPPLFYYKVDIGGLGPRNLTILKEDPLIQWWVEADRTLLVRAGDGFLKSRGDMYRIERLADNPPESSLAILQAGHTRDFRLLGAGVLVSGGRMMLISREPGASPPASALTTHALVREFIPNLVFAASPENRPQPVLKGGPAEQELDQIVAAVDERLWFNMVDTLSAWDRRTASADMPTVRQWLIRTLEALPGMEVREEKIAGADRGYNIIGTLSGRVRPEDVIVIGAHYDAIAETRQAFAAGAEDNASGTAAMLEMARIIAAWPPAATVVFVAFGGEEQGLYGSRQYARQIRDTRETVKAVLTMDMIAWSSDKDPDVLIETARHANFMAENLQAAALRYTNLRVLKTFNYWGSDHVPFLDQQMPAVLVIENDYQSYPWYHHSGDTTERLDSAQATGIIRMNLAALAAGIW